MTNDVRRIPRGGVMSGKRTAVKHRCCSPEATWTKNKVKRSGLRPGHPISSLMIVGELMGSPLSASITETSLRRESEPEKILHIREDCAQFAVVTSIERIAVMAAEIIGCDEPLSLQDGLVHARDTCLVLSKGSRRLNRSHASRSSPASSALQTCT